MGYRRRDKPPFAAWLVAQREAHGLKAEEVARRLRDQGFQAEDSTYRTWESSSGRRPAPETVNALERMFGTVAPAEGGPATRDIAELVAAISRQADAISRLVEAVEQERAARAEWERGLLSALRDLAAVRR